MLTSYRSLILIGLFSLMNFSLASTPNSKAIRGDGRALMGISHQVIQRTPLEAGEQGPHWAYQVQLILPNSAAHQADLRRGDLILSWDGVTLDAISTPERQLSLSNYLRQHKRVGDTIHVEIERQSAWLTDRQTGVRKPLNQTALMGYLKHPQENQQRSLFLDYQRQRLHKKVILGERLDDLKPPPNETLFPELELHQQAPEQVLQKIVMEATTQQAYYDLLERYQDNQKWQQGYRLKRFRYLHQQPEKVLSAGSYMTSQFINLSQKVHQEPSALYRKLAEMALWLDIRPPQTLGWIDFPENTRLEVHWQYIETLLKTSTDLVDEAFKNLSPSQRQQLTNQLPDLLQRFSESYYINLALEHQDQQLVDEQNQNLLKLLKKINYTSLLEASWYLNQLNNPNWHQQLLLNADRWFNNSSVLSRSSSYGKLIIASKANHQHRQPATFLIDLGGDDQYANGVPTNQANIWIDLAGDDVYSASVHHSQASALMGVSLLHDWQGDDDYIGSYYTQATAIAGIAALIDYQGNDEYWGQRYAQATALWGLALINDKQGHDRYQGWLYSQGVGGPKGFGLLLDEAGDDTYHATGEEPSSYRNAGNFRSSSQGFGVGFRGYASGGLGVLIDAAGRDSYRAGNFAMGAGYFYGLGLLYDAGNGDDVFHASRYGLAAAAHSAIGILINEAGDDRYQGNHVALASAAWDLSISSFWDQQGNDHYQLTNNDFSLGVAAHNGHSFFWDAAGDDTYALPPNHRPLGENHYHGGFSFALMLDSGGFDDYPQAVQKNQQLRSQTSNGLMLDTDPSVPAIGDLMQHPFD